jgi:hypothetical protein
MSGQGPLSPDGGGEGPGGGGEDREEGVSLCADLGTAS